MGGEGSGRRPSVPNAVKNLIGTEQPAQTDNAIIYLPNYSGIKDSVRKDFTSSWTAGSVVFVGSNGDFTQDNANFFWDNTNNRLGIGTTSPNALLTLRGANAVMSAGTNNSNNIQIGHAGSYGAINSQTGGNWATLALQEAGGKVGIGTTSPGSHIHIKASGTDAGQITIADNSGTLGRGLTLTSPSSSLSYAAIGLNSESSGDLRLGTNSYPDLIHLENSTGTVGIGTVVPQALLHVSGASQISVQTSGALQYANHSNPSAVVLNGAYVSGGVFVSGGELWYKGYVGTYTRLAVS